MRCLRITAQQYANGQVAVGRSRRSGEGPAIPSSRGQARASGGWCAATTAGCPPLTSKSACSTASSLARASGRIRLGPWCTGRLQASVPTSPSPWLSRSRSPPRSSAASLYALRGGGRDGSGAGRGRASQAPAAAILVLAAQTGAGSRPAGRHLRRAAHIAACS
jgi:hypothetical protein